MCKILTDLKNNIKDKNWGEIVSAWIWIYKYVYKYKLQIFIYTILGLFGTVFGLLSSVVSKNLIDAVTGFNTKSIGWVAALYVGLGISRVFINIITGKISLLINAKVSNEIQADVFDQVMTTKWEDMSDFTTGDLLTRAVGDTSTISSSVLNFLPSMITTIVNFVGAFCIVLYHDHVMAFIALAGAPVTIFTSRYRLGKMKEYQKKNQKMYSKRITFNQETFQNVQSIKAFGLIGQFSEKMRNLQNEALDLSLEQYKYQSLNSIIMSLTSMAVSYASYGFAIYRLWHGDITFGEMTLFVSLAGSLSGSFSAVINLVPMSIRVATCANRIIEIIGLPRESYEDKDKANKIKEISKEKGVFVHMEDASFAYKDGRKVYSDAVLNANPGEIIALVGPSGQGKTTTLRLFLGLIQCNKGYIKVGNPGGDTLNISPATRCLFSYVPQGSSMFYGTIAENLRMVKPDATDEEVVEALKASCAWHFVSKLDEGINTIVGERGHGFSEGQNQRLSIARALLADAPILLLDEATSALDVATERKVLRNILKKNPNRTVIVTSHRPTVFSMCNRVYMIRDEKVEEANDEDITKFLEDF